MTDIEKISPLDDSWVSSFPDSLYDMNESSHVYRLGKALVGEVDALRQQSMLARLQTELGSTRYGELDQKYGMFGLYRLESEQYSYLPSDPLTYLQRIEMDLKDASYRTRIFQYMRGLNAGGTRVGLQLAAEGGSGLHCEIVDCREFFGTHNAPNTGTVPEEDSRTSFIVYLESEEEITSEILRSVDNALSRLMPVDTDYVVRRKKVKSMYTAHLEESSSNWWQVNRSITGRLDWDYYKYPHLWVEPGIEKEAPKPALSDVQEDEIDFTYAIKETDAWDAVSRSANKKYLASFYGSDFVDWSYPVEYIPELIRSEEDRSPRSMRIEEPLVFTLQRALPVNRVDFQIEHKPCTLDINGTIVPIADSGAGMLHMSIDIPLQTVDEIVIDAEGSPEISDLMFKWTIEDPSDFVEGVSYKDDFGNLVRFSLVEKTMQSGFWVSKPNVSSDAVEYLVYDLENAQDVDFVSVQMVYPAQVNIYSSDDRVIWRYWDTFNTSECNLAMRRTRYIKLEFTNMTAIPYEGRAAARTLEFPQEVKEKSIINTVTESTYAGRLLDLPDKYEDLFNRIGSKNPTRYDYSAFNAKNIEGTDLTILQWSEMYRSLTESVISSTYGDNMAYESQLSAKTPSITPIDESYVLHRFMDEGPHKYNEMLKSRDYYLAFVVGVKKVEFGYRESLSKHNTDPFVITSYDIQPQDVDGFTLDGDRWVVSTEEVNSLQTPSIHTNGTMFRSFDFLVNETEPTQLFDHPSDMNREWTGRDKPATSTEFGLSGTTLLQEGEGITSDSKLIRARSVAVFETDVFPTSEGKWYVDCYDVYDEQIFHMEYDLPNRRWSRLGTVFTPVPGGGWWDSEYSYRVRLLISGPMAANSGVFVPFIDLHELVDSGLTNLKDLRLVYFDGISNIELDMDITDSMEFWFKLQQDLPDGIKADGYYDPNLRRFVGAYYLYFGNLNATDEPKRDWRNIWTENTLTHKDVQISDDFTDYDDGYTEIDYPLYDSGFVSFEMNREAPTKVVGGNIYNHINFIMDGDMINGERMMIYFYEDDIYVSIFENDGFENIFVGDMSDLPLYSRILVQWWEQGSRVIYDDQNVPGTDKRGRMIRVYVSDAMNTSTHKEIPWSRNVYNTQIFDEGIYDR